MAPPVGPRINQHAVHALRLLDVIELLKDGQLHSVGDLADWFGVTLRTMHRDIVELRELGFRIEGAKGKGGGIMLRKTPVAIQRLIEEVTVGEPVGGYNRTYHRHNR